MRIWHEELIPKLCRQHLLAVWREGLGCYKIITENKNGYRNHPAVKEFENNHGELRLRLSSIRQEMISRGYKPKELPFPESGLTGNTFGKYEPWQTLDEQIEVLKLKGCNCRI